MKTVTYWATLIELASEAARTGDPEDVRRWKGYEQLVLDSDEMIIGNRSNLS